MKRTKFLPAVLAAALLMAGCNINTGTVQTVTRKYDNGDVYVGEMVNDQKTVREPMHTRTAMYMRVSGKTV